MNAAGSGIRSLGSSQSVVLGIICLGVFSTALDQTVVVAALPSVMVDLEIPLTDLDRASWIVTAYLVSYTVAMPLAGRLSDVYGRVRMFQAALVLFAIGSALVAIAPNFEWV
ncbi:MAG: MFS transporter, partial [Spirochaetaceae bacterium]|nr:MFS transporter [Spirochaetaceae bacterium]